MKTKLYVLLLLTVCLTLTACDPGQRPQSISSHEPNYATTVTLWTNKQDYSAAEPVQIKFTLKNTSGKRLVLEGNPVMDIRVIGGPPHGKWWWSKEYPEQAQALRYLELEPDESHIIGWVWVNLDAGRSQYCVDGFSKRSDGLKGRTSLCIKVEWYPR